MRSRRIARYWPPGRRPRPERNSRRAFRSARSLEATDPAGATAAFRRLVDQHPEFAEGHYRLARRLGASSAWEEARPHFLAARDFDAAAVRCPSDFREAIKAVGRRHDALVIDCETLFAPLSPRGVLDDHIYHDAHHPNLVGMVVLAQDILEQLHRRRAWGWPGSTPVPRIDLAECARHFGIDPAFLATVCERCADWHRKAALICHEPAERDEVADRYDESGRAIAAGRPLPPESPPSLRQVHSVMAGSNSQEQ